MREHQGCAYHSRERDESQIGTASTVARWLLIEQPGPWGRDAFTQSGLPRMVADDLAADARRAGFRPLLVRRPAGAAARDRAAFLVATHADSRRAERVWFRDPEELLDLDLPSFTRGEPVGDPISDPLVLVCTNGRHDSCCAVEGRPVVEAAAAVLGDAVWECSHVGGDRFAANVVWLPEGIYYGRVRPQEVPELAAGMAAGRLSLPHLRGRVPYPFAVQAGEALLRRELGADGLDEFTIVSYRTLTADRIEVIAEVRGQAFRLVVAQDVEREAHLLTCHAVRPSRPRVHRLVEYRPLPSDPVREGSAAAGA